MTNDNKSPEDIEREIEHERAGLADTLDDLQERFSVERISRQFSDQFREHGGDIGRSVSEAVKRNPVALALTGVGLAWLMMGDRTRPAYRADDRHDRVHGSRMVDFDDSYDDTAGYRGGDESLQDQRTSRRYGGTSPKAPLGRSLGPQPGDPSKSYYSGQHGDSDLPNWAKRRSDLDGQTADDDDTTIGDRARAASSGISKGVSDATSAAGDTAKAAGSSVASGARSARDSASSVADSAKSAASSASDRVASLGSQIAEGTEAFGEEARERIVAARRRAMEALRATGRYSRQGRERAGDIFEDHPMIAGALALALGSAIAAALPRSRMEDEYIGEQRDQLFHEAERIYEEEKEKLTKVAQAAKEEAKSELREKKSDADAKASAGTAEQDVADKAKQSGKRIAGAAKDEAKKQNLGDIKS